MRYTRFIGATATFGIAAATLAGCAAGTTASPEEGGEDVELTVTWWGSEERIAKYEESFDIFEEEHPGVTVTGVPMDYQSYWTARSTEAAARTLPDIMQFDPANLGDYSRNDLLLDLTPYIGDTIDFSNVDENVLASSEFDGGHYGVPIGTSTLGLYYNPELGAAAGVEPLDPDYTWADLSAWVTEVAAAGATNADGQAVYGGLGQGTSIWLFLQWLLQQGTAPFTEDGGLAFTQDDIVDYLSLDTSARDAGAYLPPDRATQISPLDGFAMEEAATVLAWDNYYARYAPETGDDIEVLPVPSNEDGEKSMFFLVSNMAVAANTAHPDEATELADFLFRDPRVAEIFGTDRGIPVDSETLAGFEVEPGSGDEKVIAYEEQVAADYATEVAPKLPGGFATLESQWVRLNGELGYGNVTPEQFAEQWWAEAELAVG
ncbi:extracellular solute-binding protein [Microbacterium gilvum]|uniref:Extracellular solute-binding protein n=1 Tax=Microbacterium gilvum TaxID=1336204 RepID=A0ABP8ZYY4_9MICO